MEEGDDFVESFISLHFCKVFQGLEEVLDGITMKYLVILFRRPEIRMGINTLSSVNEHSISAKFKTGEGVDLSLHYRHHPHFGMPSDLQIRLLGRCLFSAGPAE